jgi:hypothetical protein
MVTCYNYRRAFKSGWGVVTFLLGFVPPASNWIWNGWIFPPLGNESVLGQLVAVLLAGAVVAVVYRKTFADYKIRRCKGALFALVVLGACGYLVIHSKFVCAVDIPTQSRTVNVSIGFHRSEFARTTFRLKSDVDMLEARGLDDSNVFQLWTPTSIYIARLSLFVSFCVVFLSLVGILSLTVLEHAKQMPDDSAR